MAIPKVLGKGEKLVEGGTAIWQVEGVGEGRFEGRSKGKGEVGEKEEGGEGRECLYLRPYVRRRPPPRRMW